MEEHLMRQHTLEEVDYMIADLLIKQNFFVFIEEKVSLVLRLW